MKRQLLYATAAILLLAGASVIIVSIGALDSGGDPVETEPLAVGTPLPTQAPVTASPTPAPQGDPRLATLDITRLVVPKVGINAPIIVLGILADGTMASPKGPSEVAWYNFSSKPGEIGNVVMAGHLDYIDYGAAVFYRLRDLRPGDELKLVLSDGTEVRYSVESVKEFDEATAPIRDIVGRTPNETITLITCAGSFDRQNLLYNKRLVVRGARVVS